MFKIYADGRLVKDSEIREVKKEDKVLKFLGFTLAVAGKQDEEPSYLECSVKEAKKQESEVQTEEPTISDEELFEEESYEVAE